MDQLIPPLRIHIELDELPDCTIKEEVQKQLQSFYELHLDMVLNIAYALWYEENEGELETEGMTGVHIDKAIAKLGPSHKELIGERRSWRRHKG